MNGFLHSDGAPVVADESKPCTLAELAERNARLRRVAIWADMDPQYFGFAKRRFYFGDFSECGRLFGEIMDYDATVATVAPKRFRAVAGLDWEIATLDDTPEAKQQAELLEDFYENLVASDVEAPDMAQGIETLIFQLMTATAMKYACAEIQWIPATTADGKPTYHARTLACPLHYFEATTRRLRILTQSGTQGEAMDEKTWIVAAHPGTPLMLPTMLLFMLKMTPLEDWASAVEAFAIPFVIGRTSAAKGSPEWNALLEFVAHAKNRFAGVIGKDAEVEVLNGLTQPPPHRDLVDYLDRAIAALWRGGDLSTFSAGDSTGSNPQLAEMGDIQKMDSAFITSVLATRLSKPFLEFIFGTGTPIKAYFKFVEDDTAMRAARIADIKTAYDLGLSIPENFAREALGIPAVAPEDRVLQRASGTPAADLQGFGIPNAQTDIDAMLAYAERAQFGEIESALRELEAAESDEMFAGKLSELKRRFPAIMQRVMNRNDVVNALGGVE